MKIKQLNDLETTLEEYLREHVPITSAMGVSVGLASPDKIILSASFKNNINHKKTVFGGSLHAVATLACWSLLHVNLVNLSERNVQSVIARSEVNYLLPVTTDFQAECSMPAVDWERFFKMLQKKGKARLMLSAKIFQDDRLCVDYTGVFVAIGMVEKSQKVDREHR